MTPPDAGALPAAVERRVRPRWCLTPALLALAGGLLSPLSVAAQPPEEVDPQLTRPREQLGELPINKDDPESSVPTPQQAVQNPIQFGYLLMDLATQAELAEKRGQLPQAIKFYRALAKAAPDKAISYGKMCAVYEAMGDRDRGLSTCRQAMGRVGARSDDYVRYVRLLLGPTGPVPPAQLQEIREIMQHLDREPGTAPAAIDVKCQLGARLQDLPLLEACVAGLNAADPKAVRTLSYGWALALRKRDYTEASRLVKQAQVNGLDPQEASRMQREVQWQKWSRRVPLWGGLIVALVGLWLLTRRPLSPRAARLLPRQPA